ncbi:HU family DNA-binding protein [Bacteroides acidifaciens]|uniref:HU family DNA-binding protein n=1 Tax=Bacteroides acidifaciens TaxID=85831 RepID=UPI00242B06C9|nr:HU family DNA-binding protein [Bacteroides acidifaciens]
MAIQFEFYKNPQPVKEGEEPSYHPRVVNFQHVTTQRLAREIHMATTFGKSEVEAMLMELSRCMSNHLREGERVHLDGIGYFQITLQATEPIHSLTTRADKVKLKSISFQADRDLKSSCMATHLRRSKYKPHSVSLTEEEIDRKLTEYFATHPVLTRSNMQSLCCFTQSMASRQIRRLKAEGKLQNIGKPTQPIYVAGSGYYEK